MHVATFLLIVSAVIGIGFFANFIFKRTNIPDIVWLLLLGLLIGPVLRIVSPETLIGFLPYFSAIALLIILFDAGININLYRLLEEAPRGLALALSGFVLSMLGVGWISYLVLELSYLKSLLLGAILGGVSSAIVIPVVSELRGIREDSKLVLDIESALTDPLCIIVSFALIGMILPYGSVAILGLKGAIEEVVASFSISIVIGLLGGIFWLIVFQFLRDKDYNYMLTLAFLFFMYPLVESVGGNGAIASLMIGLSLGNGRKLAKMLRIEEVKSGLGKKTKEFHSYISFFVKTFFFVTLGLIISLSRLDLFLYGLGISLVLLGIRFLAVKISTISSDIKNKDIEIMGVMIPRGLAAAVLAPLVFFEYGIPGTKIFTEIVFSVIIFTAIISTIGIFLVEKYGS